MDTQNQLPNDSAATGAEKSDRQRVERDETAATQPPPSKKRRIDTESAEALETDARDKVKGIALVKAE